MGIFPEDALVRPGGRMRPAGDLVARGRALAGTIRVGDSAFSRATGHRSEAAYKRARMADGRIMQHAHIGFRDIARTLEGIAAVHAGCLGHGVVVDRFGITLDWSMGYPPERRDAGLRGTGIVLAGPDDFRRITGAAPAACHFGDFMIGMPASVENASAAVAAGATSIGNLGQYFTFRLPEWDDDVATTEATVTALAFLAAQDGDVTVHSNLDDGFAALFTDMASSLGMVLIEQHVVERLLGGRLAHCYGHHFADPRSRHAFQTALQRVSDPPGTMIYGNTVSYRSTTAGNYASLASYLLIDLLGQRRRPTGHAVNPVPVSENERIPDVDEIVDAQVFAARLGEHAAQYMDLIDWRASDAMAEAIVAGGRRFARNVLEGLAAHGVDTADPAAILLTLRRLGARRLEDAYGAGPPAPAGRRRPLVPAGWVEELDDMARRCMAAMPATDEASLRAAGLRACIATSDVHEHGKYLVEKVLDAAGVAIVDGGVAVDPDDLATAAVAADCDVVAVSTYNGVALRYVRALMAELERRGRPIPVLVGGRLNEVPEGSNTSLPVDVTAELRALGAWPCAGIEDLAPMALRAVSRKVGDQKAGGASPAATAAGSMR